MPQQTVTDFPKSGGWPICVQDLTDAERLVVWAFRRWVCGSAHRALLVREFSRQFRKPDVADALQAFDASLCGLTRGARRRISHHLPCCPCLCADEVCFLAIVAAQQSGAYGAARAMALWLVRSGHAAAMVDPLAVFSDRLQSSGHDLPYRTAGQARDPIDRPVTTAQTH